MNSLFDLQTLEAKGKVTKQYKEDLIEVVKANMLRYQNDQQLMFKAVAESANLTLTPDLYKDLSKSVEVGYKTFESSQRSKCYCTPILRIKLFTSTKL